jgi:hypothetical protein
MFLVGFFMYVYLFSSFSTCCCSLPFKLLLHRIKL